jgi:hypothetical protein
MLSEIIKSANGFSEKARQLRAVAPYYPDIYYEIDGEISLKLQH